MDNPTLYTGPSLSLGIIENAVLLGNNWKDGSTTVARGVITFVNTLPKSISCKYITGGARPTRTLEQWANGNTGTPVL